VVEAYGEDQLTQKLTTEFTAGKSDIDVFMQRPLQEARVMKKNGYYEDLTKYVSQDAAYDFKDFMSGAVGTTTVDGFLTGVPIVTEQEVLYYRKDLLEAAGLKVPTTIDELKDTAAKLTNKDKELYGFVARGQRSPLVTQFSSFLYSYGGDWFDQKTMKASIDTPEALQAMETYSTLLREYGPPGTLNMSWPQAVAIFAQGKVAMYTDASAIFNNLLDPTKSEVADKTGVARFPAGPAGAINYSVTSWGLAMYSGSDAKDAAWEFIKWATSKEVTLKTQGQALVPSARQSVWSDPAGTEKFPKDWVEAVKVSGNGRGYDRPLVTQVGKARDIIGQAVVTGIEGGDFKTAAQKANQEFQALLDTEK
jgi:multiple sugar transport system substrate-binding protein